MDKTIKMNKIMTANNKINRKQRRSTRHSFKAMVTEAIGDNDWGEWENHSQKLRDNPDIAPEGTVGFYANNFCSVQIKPIRAKLGTNLARMGIRLHDESTRIGWAEKQRIKNTLIGEE